MINLRDYQERIAAEACGILQSEGMAYLAMEVRTGKTLTSLYTAHLYQAKSVLFVTKKKAISSIELDAEALNVAYNLHVINYEQLPKVLHNKYDFIILDEAHGLGAYPKPSERTKLLRSITRASPVLFLSGTPTPESDSQIYHQLYVSMHSPFEHYANFYKWAADYVDVKQRSYGHGMINDYSKACTQKIWSEISHLFIRYSQEDAGFTEFVDEEVVHIDMKPSTYKFADRLKADRVISNKDGDFVLADTEVKLMQKLHQIYSGSVIIDQPKRTSSAFDTTKAEYIAKNWANNKIAIFYKFIAEEVILRSVLGARIVDTPEEFNASEGNAIYISQVQSGREGINLSSADALIMFNIDFAAVSYFQARARIQSKDRDRPAKLYWLFSKDGIERKIYERVKNKQDYTLKYFKKDYL